MRFGTSTVWFGIRHTFLVDYGLIHHEIICFGLTLEWETKAWRV